MKDDMNWGTLEIILSNSKDEIYLRFTVKMRLIFFLKSLSSYDKMWAVMCLMHKDLYYSECIFIKCQVIESIASNQYPTNLSKQPHEVLLTISR